MPSAPLSVSISSNGSRATLPVSNDTLVMGTCSSGTDTQIVSIGSTAALVTEFGIGPLVQLAAQYLSTTGRPVKCMRLNDSVAATMGSVTATRVATSTGTVTNNSSAPNDAYDVIVEVLSSGTVAATSFTWRYSLDGGDNYSGTLVGASSATLGSSGIALTFTDNSGGDGTRFADGDLHTFTTTAPGFASADLTAGLTSFQNSDSRVRRIHPASTSVGMPALYSAIRTAMNTIETAYKWTTIVLDSDDRGAGPEAVATWQAGVLTDWATDDDRCQVVGGWEEVQMVLPVGTDVLQLRRPSSWVVGPRQASIDVSQDAGAVVDGSLENSVIASKTALNPTGLDIDGRLYTAFEGRGITTVQTYLGRTGVFCGGAFMRVSSTNDFYRVAHRQVMDVACETAYDILLDYINTNVGLNANGTILEQEAQAIEARLNGAILATLVNVSPPRISPSDEGVYAEVDRTNIISTTEQLAVTVSLIPRAFIGTVALAMGYTISVPVAT